MATEYSPAPCSDSPAACPGHPGLLFARFLYGQQASSAIVSSDLVGLTAQVSVAIPENGVGQVRCLIGESMVDKIAQSKDGHAIAFNSVVKIDALVGESVIVSPAGGSQAAARNRAELRLASTEVNSMNLDLQTLAIPILVLVVLLSFLIVMWLFARNYIKVPPNAAAVFSGRKRKLPDGRVVGYRLVKGRGGPAHPATREGRLPLAQPDDHPSRNQRAYTLAGVPVSVKAVANVKIKSDDISLQAAAERFLGMSLQEVQKVIFQTLEGHLRAILGTLTVEEINNDRQSFAQKLTTEATSDLERMGIGVDVLTIQEISDEEGYLDALGKKRTSEVKRDATIGEAEATRDSKIRSSVAMQEGEKVKLDTEANISLAHRDLEVKKAQYQAEVEKERSTAEQAGPLSSAKARQAVVIEEVRIEKVRTQEQISVQEQEILRREKELEATIVKPADAARTAAVLKAEASKQSAILEAEGRRASLIAIAEADQERLRERRPWPRRRHRSRRQGRSGQDRSDRFGSGEGDRGSGACGSDGHIEESRSVEAVQRSSSPTDDPRETAWHHPGFRTCVRSSGRAFGQHR